MNKMDIFKNYSLKTSTLTVPNWGGDISIRELSAGAMQLMRTTEGSELEMAAIVVLHGVIDDEGKRMFNDADKKKILDMSAGDLVLVSSAIVELSDLAGTKEEV
tara:strand:- start:7709 stop:8020 length:312 start_codon:yes stop_codon:yes gene_type:complete